ncbi:aminotransferase class I/II-fold pyridoxal phosphate-dependent enzyme [Patescibacteria group bacterium]
MPSKIIPSRRTENVTYAVRDIVVLAQKTKETGKEMLWLNIGDPLKYDFETPVHMIEAVSKAMREGHNGYSASSGTDEAIAAIRKEAEKAKIGSIRDILITNGGSEAIEIGLTSLLNPGDNILTPNPGYPLYEAIINKLEAEENQYELDEENGWQPDINDIESKINDKTKGIVVINPNNPTGSVCHKDTLLQIIELARKHNLVIFSDEIYDKLIFDGKEYTSIASLADDVCFVTLNGLSKSYLVPGWRLGWAIISGPQELCGNYVEAYNKFTRARLCSNHPMQFAIKPALEGPQDHIAHAIQKLEKRRDICMEILNSIDGISCVSPEGAFYAFPRLERDLDDKEWVEGLISETGVVTVHGSGFGQKAGTHHFRIVLLPDEQTLEKACLNIKEYMKKFS